MSSIYLQHEVIWRYDNNPGNFKELVTAEGFCRTFNMLGAKELYKRKTGMKTPRFKKRTDWWSMEKGYSKEANLDAYPYRAFNAGMRESLTLSLLTDMSRFDYWCQGSTPGFKVTVHHPTEFPDVTEKHFKIQPGDNVIVSVTPDIMTTSESLKSYSPKSRQCYFQHERKLSYFKIYNQNNCHLECLTDNVISNCRCVGFYMPRVNKSVPICGSGSGTCISRIEWAMNIRLAGTMGATWSEDLELTDCDCLPPCNSIKYRTDLSISKLDTEKPFDDMANKEDSEKDYGKEDEEYDNKYDEEDDDEDEDDDNDDEKPFHDMTNKKHSEKGDGKEDEEDHEDYDEEYYDDEEYDENDKKDGEKDEEEDGEGDNEKDDGKDDGEEDEEHDEDDKKDDIKNDDKDSKKDDGEDDEEDNKKDDGKDDGEEDEEDDKKDDGKDDGEEDEEDDKKDDEEYYDGEKDYEDEKIDEWENTTDHIFFQKPVNDYQEKPPQRKRRISRIKRTKLTIYFADNQFTTSKRKELYGTVEFIANCGGLLSLFSGLSLLSIIEIKYFITLRLWNKIRSRRNPEDEGLNAA